MGVNKGQANMRTKVMKTLSFCLTLALSAALLGAAPWAADVADAGREARWQEISKYIFGDRGIEPTESLIKIDAPKRALDAALVPITLRMPGQDRIKGVYLVIDENPSPFAAHFSFGPAADPRQVTLRVRINSYTNVHAVAETADGKLYAAVAFVKASGGCSAPMGVSDKEAMQGMGEMRMKFAGGPGESLEATLMIRHPNFNGMQMNQITRTYTPARYINRINVSYGDKDVVSIDGDISVSSDPVFVFSFLPEGAGPVRVVASDTKGGHWEQTFSLPSLSN
jgi:sulfur-oxidizing protein SoxY